MRLYRTALAGVLVAWMGCKGGPATEPIAETDADTDADSDTDTDTDADTDADSDADADVDTDTGLACGEDALEDNDTLQQAVATTGETGLWVRLGDPDYWSFEVPDGHEVRVIASHDALSGDIDVYVLDADGSVIGIPGATFANDEVAYACNGTGGNVTWNAYVEIWELALETCNTYDLTVTTIPAAAGCGNDTGLDSGDTAPPPDDTGLTGDTGASGPTGDTGTAAPTGDTGLTGDTAP